jgi:hypothetical protein
MSCTSTPRARARMVAAAMSGLVKAKAAIFSDLVE